MKKQFFTILFSIILLNVFATQKYVTKNGFDSSNDGTQNRPWATISYALSQANAGDTIVVGVGTFTEHSILIDKAITISGVGAAYSVFQADSIQAKNEFVFDIQSNVTINGLTIRHGSPGIRIGSNASLKITDSNILNCYSEAPGAGINVAGVLNMERCCVANNENTISGAGIYASRTSENPAQVKIINSTISHNRCTGGGSMGGGMVINAATLELQNSTVAFNSAKSKGKGMHMNGNSARIITFTNNIVAGNGIPDIGSNYATSFPESAEIDYNVISLGWSGYLNFGDNSIVNVKADSIPLNAFIDSIALQPLQNVGTGVLAHPINNESYLVLNNAGDLATATDVRNTPRAQADIGAYEYIDNAPITALSILNIDSALQMNEAVRIAVAAFPSYTTENYKIYIDPESDAQVNLSGDTLIASSSGMLKVWATSNETPNIKAQKIFNITEEIGVGSISLSLPTAYNSIFPGENLQVISTVEPQNAKDKTVLWSVNDTQLGVISNTGLFEAKAIGTVIVTARATVDTSISSQIEIKIIDTTPVDISVNGDYVYKEGIKNPCGAVLCWLTDSDIERPRNRSMETALSEMKAGSLRFPYGALSNNYIWTKDPQNISNGLEPCIAVPDHGPGYWEWAVDEEGYFKKDMDFDEYVALCRKVGAEPVVCVNIMSHVFKQNDDITIDTLIYYAKEWLRYANITKGYDIKYWQLGNEQDHHANIYPLNQFKVDYKRMATAMHEVDPNIKTSPGLLQNWNSEILNYCPDYVNFISCHQYLWFGGSETEAYSAWKDYGPDLVPHIKKNQDILSSSNRNLEIFVTETGITGGMYPDPQVFNLYKGLILFEMQMEQIITPNVRNTFYWGTHTPWNGEFGDGPMSTLFSNDDANENHMQADVLSAINTHIQEKYFGRITKSGIVTYTTVSANDSLVSVFVLNKNEAPKNLSFTTQNIGAFKNFEKWTFAGNSEFDSNVNFKQEFDGQVSGNLAETTLPPLSITIIKLELNDDGGTTSVKQSRLGNDIKLYPNPVKNRLNIECETDIGIKAIGTITSVSGKIIKQFSASGLSVIDVSDLATGIYILNISDSKKVRVHKFIKE